MHERRRIILLIGIMTAVVFGVAAIVFYTLYQAALNQQRDRLTEAVEYQARLIEAIAQDDQQEYGATHTPAETFAVTLAQVKNAQQEFKGLSRTGEFVLSERQGDQIVFLLPSRHTGQQIPAPVPFASKRAEPSRRALSGESGTLIGLDYSGTQVLAAYEPVNEYGLGIVAKIDLAEIRAPFIRAGEIGFGAALGLILLGTLLFLQITTPLVRRLEDNEARYRAVFEQAADAIVLVDPHTGQLVEFNARAYESLGYTRDEFHQLKLFDVADEAPAAVAARILQTVEEGEAVFEARRITKSGEIREISINSRTISIRGKKYILSIWHDITDHLRMERALREGEARYRAVFEQAADSIVLIDPQSGQIVEFNNRACEDLGYTRDEFRQLELAEIEFDETPEELAAAIKRIVEKGSDIFEDRHKTRSGQERNLVVSSQVIGVQGKQYLLSIWHDITERRRMEETLRANEAQLRALYNSMNDLFALHEIVYDEAGRAVDYRVLDCNPAYRRITGIPREQTVGVLASQLYHTEKAPYLEVYARVAAGGDPARFETYFAELDKHFDISVFSPGKKLFATVAADITERKLIEEALFQEFEVSIALAALYKPLISPSASLKDIGEIVLDEARQLTNSAEGFVSVIDPVTKDNISYALIYEGETRLQDDDGAAFPRSPDGTYPNLWGYSLNTHQAFFTNTPREHPAYDGIPEGHHVIERFLSVPVLLRDEVVGQIALSNADRDYTNHDVNVVGRIAEYYALAIQRMRAEEALRRQNDYLVALQETTLDLGAQLDLDRLLENIVRRAGQLVGTSSGFLELLDPATDQFVPKVGLGIFAGSPWLTGQPLPPGGDSTLPGGNSALPGGGDTLPGRVPESFLSMIRSMMGVPLRSGERILGVLGLVYDTSAPPHETFGPEKVELLNQFARLAALAIDNAQLFAKAEQELAERRRTGVALRESEARYRSLFEDSPISLWEEDYSAAKTYIDGLRDAGVTDLKAYFESHPDAVRQYVNLIKVLEVNQLTLDLYRAHSREELTTGLGVVIGESDMTGSVLDEVRRELVSLAEGKTHFEGELPQHKITGEIFDAFLSMSIAPGYEDTWEKAFVSIIDISERKRIERAERQQRAMAEALRDTAAILTSTLDLDEVLDRILAHIGRVVPHDTAGILLIEDGFTRNVRTQGYSVPALEEWARSIRFAVAEVPTLRRMVETGLPLVISDTQNHPDWKDFEQTRWVHSFAGAPIRIEEQVIGFLVLDSGTPGFFGQEQAERLRAFADQAALAIRNARLYDEIHRLAMEMTWRVIQRTTQLNQAKERVETILNNSSDIILLLNQEGLIQQVNPMFNKTFDCNREEATGQPLTILAAPECVAPLEQALHATLEQKLPQRLEIVVLYRHCVMFNADAALSPVVQKNGEVTGVVCSLRDITVSKQTEVSLRRMLERETELGEMKSRFISTMSHEFRTPLSVIRSASDILKHYSHKMTEEAKQKEYRQIETSIGYVVSLLDDLLTINQAQRGKLGFKPVPIDLEALCRDILASFEQTTGKEHMLVFSPTGSRDALPVDPKLLRHIVSNLLSNAFKYSPPGSTVQFDLACEPAQVTLQVKDQGIGIPPGDLAQVFEPFHRAQNVGTVRGTGLGLAIVKQAVDLHGGTIQVQSSEGSGTTFTVILPLTAAEQTPA